MLGGQPLALGGGLETIDGGLGSGAGFVALDVHPGRRQAVQDRRRDHGIESKGDTGDVGLERGGDGKGEFGGRIAGSLQGQVHDEVLDHGPISRMAAHRRAQMSLDHPPGRRRLISINSRRGAGRARPAGNGYFLVLPSLSN